MKEFIVLLVLGIAFIPFGIFTMLGNTHPIKYRSKRNLSEANRRAFCFIYGIGFIIMSVGLIVCAFVFRLSGGKELTMLTLVPFLIAEVIISVIATVKYNR